MKSPAAKEVLMVRYSSIHYHIIFIVSVISAAICLTVGISFQVAWVLMIGIMSVQLLIVSGIAILISYDGIEFDNDKIVIKKKWPRGEKRIAWIEIERIGFENRMETIVTKEGKKYFLILKVDDFKELAGIAKNRAPL